LAFSPEFSAVRSSSCAFKAVLSVAAYVAIPVHSRRSSVAGKGSKATIRSSIRRGSTHVVCPQAARIAFGSLPPRRRSSYKLSTGP
jgi:hypothetical protein